MTQNTTLYRTLTAALPVALLLLACGGSSPTPAVPAASPAADGTAVFVDDAFREGLRAKGGRADTIGVGYRLCEYLSTDDSAVERGEERFNIAVLSLVTTQNMTRENSRALVRSAIVNLCPSNSDLLPAE